MAKKTSKPDQSANPSSKRGRPKKHESTVQFSARIDAKLAEDVERYQRLPKFPPTKTDILELALRDFLDREGYRDGVLVPPLSTKPAPPDPDTVLNIYPLSYESFSLPFAGEIAAGKPISTTQVIDEEYDFQDSLGGPGRYVLRVKGTSMVDHHIDPGDYVVIQQITEANPGDVVVALVGGELTLKKLVVHRPGETKLRSCDGEGTVFTLKPRRGDQIIGGLVGVVRKVLL